MTINPVSTALAACAVSICTVATITHAQPGTQPGATLDTLRQKLDLSGGSLQALALPSDTSRSFTVAVTLDGRDVELTLAPASVRSEDFRVLMTDADGRLVEQPVPSAQTYRGGLAGMPGASVAATISGGGMRAYIRTDDDLWAIQPAREVDANAGASLHMVYRQGDLAPLPVTCGADAVNPLHDGAAQSGGGRGGSCGYSVAEIAFDADREFYQLNNSSVADTAADIESIVNAMNVIYERDVNITHVITAIIVRTTEPDGYETTDSFYMLGEMQTKWNAEHCPAGPNPVHRDMAHLMTGKNLAGSIIGRAWVSAVCSDMTYGFGYGLSQSRYSSNFMNRVSVTAHEVGHNWSANHCNGDPDCGVMCSSIGGCGPVDLFGDTAIDSMVSYRDTRVCLDSGGVTNDCNGNCIDDGDEIASGAVADCDGNGVPDECETAQQTCPEDITGDGRVDVFDLFALLAEWGVCETGPCSCPCDLDSDEQVNVFDLFAMLDAWGNCP